MIRALLVCSLAFVQVAAAQMPPEPAQRRNISPIAIHGDWIGGPGAVPEDCNGDGYLINLFTGDGKTFIMSVRPRTGGVTQATPTETRMDVVAAPPGTPLRIDVFLSGPGSDIGIAIRTGSAMELIPAGPQRKYDTTSLFLKRCIS